MRRLWVALLIVFWACGSAQARVPLDQQYCAVNGEYNVFLWASDFRYLAEPYIGYATKPDQFVEEPWDGGGKENAPPELELCAFAGGFGWTCYDRPAQCQNNFMCTYQIKLGLPSTALRIKDADVKFHDDMHPVFVDLAPEKPGKITMQVVWDQEDYRPVKRKVASPGWVDVEIEATRGWQLCGDSAWLKYLGAYKQPIVEGVKLKELFYDTECINGLIASERGQDLMGLFKSQASPMAPPPAAPEQILMPRSIPIGEAYELFNFLLTMDDLASGTYTDAANLMGMDMAAWPGLIRKIRADKSDFGKYMNSCLNKHSLGGR